MDALRNINEGLFGWYEKGAMQLIEDRIERKKQASCKLIYIGICSMSAKQKNSPEITCYKFDLARFASVSEKTVQRYLPELENVGIIKMSPQDRMSNGKFDKVKIWLSNANLTAGHLRDSSETDARQLGDTESDIYKKKKEIKKTKKDNSLKKVKIKHGEPSFAHPIVQNLWKTLENECQKHGLVNEVNPEMMPALYDEFATKLKFGEQIRDCVFYHKNKNPKKSIKTMTLKNWMKNAIEFAKQKELKRKYEQHDKAASFGVKRSDIPGGKADDMIKQMAQKMSF